MIRMRGLTNPWWIVLGSTLGLALSNAAVLIYTFTLFIKPIGAEFDWSRQTLSAAYSAMTVGIALTVPLVGAMMDRWGVRKVMLAGIGLFALSVGAISLTPNRPGVFIALYGLAGVIGAAQSMIGYVKSIAGWFDRRRGLALGIAMAGIGVGAAILPPVIQGVITDHGWRAAYLVLALLLIVIALPSVALFLREPAAGWAMRQGLTVDKPPLALPGHLTREALASGKFWLIAVSVLLVGMVVQGVTVHLVPLLTDRGVPAAQAASMLAILGVSTIIGRLLFGFLVDVIFAPVISIVFFLMPIGGMYLLSQGQAPEFALVTLGLAVGAELDLLGFLVSRYFGLRRFGQIYGWLFCAFTLGCAAGVYLMGWSFEAFDSYNPALIGFSVCLLVASAVMPFLGRYTYPVGH